MTFLNSKCNPNCLREWSLLNDLRKIVTAQSNQLILTRWPFVCPHCQQTLRLGCTRWKLTCSYRIRCFVSNVNGLVMDKRHVKSCDTYLKCGEEGHDGKSCQKSPKCKNCKRDHMASPKHCPIWIKEKEIQKVKTKGGIAYPEAKKIVNMYSVPKPNIPSSVSTFKAPSSKEMPTQAGESQILSLTSVKKNK